ncbi:MAG: hypothetical protein ACI93B_002174 [Yoonia sp.]|jgi:hypothetical protein
MVRKHRGMPIFTRIVLGCVDESVRFAQCGHSLRLHTKSMLGRIASGRTTISAQECLFPIGFQLCVMDFRATTAEINPSPEANHSAGL